MDALDRIVAGAELPPADPLTRAQWYSARISAKIRESFAPGSAADLAAVSLELQEMAAGMMTAMYQYMRDSGLPIPEYLTDFNHQLKVAAEKAKARNL